MTFIASVIARNGVAVIADSLVTTTHPVLEYTDFLDFLTEKEKKSKSKTGKVNVDAKEILPLFEYKPHYTKDYEDKLFKYDDYTAITTAGNAYINEKRIANIIEELRTKNNNEQGYKNKKIETKVSDFCKYISNEIKTHLKNNVSISSTTFIISNYNIKNNEVMIFRVFVNPSSEKYLEDNDYRFIDYKKSEEFEKVVGDGQNKLSEKILFGDLPALFNFIPKIVNRIATDFNVDMKKIDKKYIERLQSDREIIPLTLFSDAKITKLSELSIQQAVDLAWLLMRVEIDFQKYTEDIPTVGGVIKLAKIDKNGFKFITGEEIVNSQN